MQQSTICYRLYQIWPSVFPGRLDLINSSRALSPESAESFPTAERKSFWNCCWFSAVMNDSRMLGTFDEVEAGTGFCCDCCGAGEERKESAICAEVIPVC